MHRWSPSAANATSGNASSGIRVSFQHKIL
jgi:hypothetical protein